MDVWCMLPWQLCCGKVYYYQASQGKYITILFIVWLAGLYLIYRPAKVEGVSSCILARGKVKGHYTPRNILNLGRSDRSDRETCQLYYKCYL